MTLEKLSGEWVAAGTVVWLVMDAIEVVPLAVQAARFVSGWSVLESLDKGDGTLPKPEDILPSTAITNGEWATIKPLFVLYVELQNSMRLEASRSLGTDVYGRATSEITADITRMESEEIPRKCFREDVMTVGDDGLGGASSLGGMFGGYKWMF